MKAESMKGTCGALALCMVAGLATTVMAGPKELQTRSAKAAKRAPAPKQVEVYNHELQRRDPIAVANYSIDMSTGRPRVTRTSEWHAYEGNVGRATVPRFFDCFEGENGNKMGGVPVGGDTTCGLAGPGYRYYGGADYSNPNSINDMTIEPASAVGVPITHIDLSWYENAGTTNLIYFLFLANDFDDTCAGPPASNYATNGVSLNFGAGSPGGYYSNVELTTITLDPLTGDASGAYHIVLSNGQELTDGTIILHPVAQPFLWGTGDAETVDDGRVGTQGPIGWDDDTTAGGSVNAPDGIFQAPNECYDYTGPDCLNPLGTILSIGGEGGDPGCYADCNGDGSLSVADFTCFRNAYLAGNVAVADCTGEGTLSVADFTCFRNAYLAGCP